MNRTSIYEPVYCKNAGPEFIESAKGVVNIVVISCLYIENIAKV